MVGIVVIAHENLAEELIRAAEYILGQPAHQVLAVGVGSDRNADDVRQRLVRALDQVRGDDGAILLADMFGGTPANLAMELMEPGQVEVITGVNLPMLVRLLTYRDRTLEEQVTKAAEGARHGVLLGRDHCPWPPPHGGGE